MKTVKISTAIVSVVLAALIAFGVTFCLCRKENTELENKIKKYSLLIEADEKIRDNFIGEYDSKSVIEGGIAGLISGLDDKWSYYVTAEDYQSYSENSTNSYVGIGVSVRKEDGEYVEVTDVTSSSPAQLSGIMPGDYITVVEGQDVKPMSLDDVKNMIRGKEGTSVTITFKRENGMEITKAVTRETIHEQAVIGEIIDDIGYIKILNFNGGVGSDFISTVEDQIKNGVKGFVFDVRCNGGGKLVELIKMLDYLLPSGDIFISRDKQGEESVTVSDSSCLQMPIAVLVNDLSYSAAEYFAAVIQEYGWGTIVGQATTGKGYSQIPIDLSDGSALVLSTREYVTPHRISLADVGITPDIEHEVEDEEYYALYVEQLEHEDDSQLQLALEIVREKIK